MRTVMQQPATVAAWRPIPAQFDSGVGGAGAVGVIALSTDRATIWDIEQFLAPIDGLGVFATRIPMAPVATPASLAALRDHLAAAADVLVPGLPLDVVVFSCTSGTVAIGADAVRQAIRSVRADAKVTTAMEAGERALRTLGCRRPALLTPYRRETAALVAGYFEDHGYDIAARLTFDLDGDRDMNRVTADCLFGAAVDAVRSGCGADSLFISCTGLRTSPVVERIEAATGLPVVTSNQAQAWEAARAAGRSEAVPGRGRLFRTMAAA